MLKENLEKNLICLNFAKVSEELLFHFHSWLYKLSESEPLDLSKHLHILSSETEGESKFQVVKIIRNLFESFEKVKIGGDFLAPFERCYHPLEGETDHSVQFLID